MEFDLNRDKLSKVHLHEPQTLYSHELVVECAFWHQKAGVKWMKERDVNTAYFHGLLKQR